MIVGFLILGVPIMAVISLMLYMPAYLINRRKYGKRPFLRHLSIFALTGVLVSLFYTTIFVGGIQFESYHLINLRPFIWVKETYGMGFRKMVEQLLLNVGMLVPLGFIFPVVFKRLRKWYCTVGSIVLLVLGIETLQYFIGRSADVDDLIMNTAGGILGYGMFFLCSRVFRDKIWWNRAIGEKGCD